MKRLFLLAVLFAFGFATNAQLMPYTLASQSDKSVASVESEVITALEDQGFTVVGSYSPATEVERRVVVITRDDLLSQVSNLGGLNGFMAVLRVGITVENEKTVVSYTTPAYWGNAYLRDAFVGVEKLFESLDSDLRAALSDGTVTQFGSKSGLEADKLQNYKYMMGMPKFDDTHILNEFSSFEEAVQTLDGNIASGVENTELVYSVSIPGSDLKLYGFGLAGEDGEGSFMPTIDISTPKHTAFLPYELLVIGNEIHMLHGRFRIALSFPDLKMGTFMKIVSTPKDIKRRFEDVTSPNLN